jgi:hypothetical protein
MWRKQILFQNAVKGRELYRMLATLDNAENTMKYKEFWWLVQRTIQIGYGEHEDWCGELWMFVLEMKFKY